MNCSDTIASPRRGRRWIVVVLLVFTACVAGLVLWIGNVTHITRDPLFRGKGKSEWIKNLKGS